MALRIGAMRKPTSSTIIPPEGGTQIYDLENLVKLSLNVRRVQSCKTTYIYKADSAILGPALRRDDRRGLGS